ncbi:recombinase family protein [Pontivivens ytuae]|uniref:Recombinase family protein n=1 Tax=Pontivivens ytuae TaxID=2789856 RepID=A0A7S9LU22_9RHOB|nr:recombinase family protein [Pontivivens ytuae]QPH54750.1 recombinase family protein [Pontivivens ytuae]
MTVWPIIETSGQRIGYARVSTKDQKLRMQRDALKAVACHAIYEDHGVSGAKASRSGLDAMLGQLKAGDTVVVFKLDRLGRSVLHLADLLVRFEREGIHFCSLSEGINTATPGGKLVYHLFSAFAEFQRDIIAENTQAGLDAARRRGKRLGRPPVIDLETVLEAHRLIAQDDVSLAEAARRLGVSRATLGRAIRRVEQSP